MLVLGSGPRRVRRFSLVAVTAALPVALLVPASGPVGGPASRIGSEPAVTPRSYGLPVDFVRNDGQWPADTRFAATSGELMIRFEPDGIALRDRSASVDLRFEAASHEVAVTGEQPRSGRYNYYQGADPARWRSGVEAFGAVRYGGLYEGVDARVREQDGELAYDLFLAAGADLDRVVIRADGASELRVEKDGTLVTETTGGLLRQRPPVAWQTLRDGARRPVASRFRLLDGQRYGFEVPGRDPSLPLVIDPGLDWATFLGGSGDETVPSVEMASGEVVVAGLTWSPDFPRTGGNLVPTGGTPYVARLSATGTSLVYATFFGGSGNNIVNDLAVDASGRPVVVGTTSSVDFPTTPGAFDRSPPDGFHGDYDAFAVKFDAAGGGPVFSTYLGSSPSSANLDEAWAAGVDASGAVVVAGKTTGSDFPTTVGAYDRTRAGQDIFISRLSTDGSQLTYSTFLGGDGADEVFDLTVDSQGFVNLTGKISQFDNQPAPFPTTANAFDRTFDGGGSIPGIDAYLARLKLDGAGTADLKYSTFLGGAQYREGGTGVAVDPADPTSVTVAGWTYSADFPTTVGALQRTHFAPVDTSMAFVSRFRFPSGGAPTLQWSTLYGAPGNQSANDVVVDSTGAAIIVGATAANNPATTQRAYDRTPGVGRQGKADGVVARISADGSQLLYATLLGGTSNGDTAVGVAYAGGSSVVVTGLTNATDFPVTAGAFDTVYAADGLPSDRSAPGTLAEDVFVARLTLQAPTGGDSTAPAAPALSGPANGAAFTAGRSVTFDWSDVADPSGIEAYHIQVSPNSAFTNDMNAELSGWAEYWLPTSLAVEPFELSEVGTFYWRVQAIDGEHNLGPFSAVRTIQVSSPPAPAPPPPLPQATAIAGLQVSPDTVNGGSTAQGTVTLNGPAPSGGALVALASQYQDRATVPASVTVSAGASSATFTITTASRAYPLPVAISGEYGGTTQGALLSILGDNPPRELDSLTINGTTIGQSTGTTGTITLAGGATVPASVALAQFWTAGPGGAVIALGSTDPALVSVPSQVTIPPGGNSASFTVTTQPVSTVTRVAVLASRSWTMSMTLELLPAGALQALTLNPSTVIGGDTSQATVGLSGPAPAGGVVVSLSSTNPALAPVPPTVTVPAGASATTFPIATNAVTSGQGEFSVITAMAGGLERSAVLNINPGPPPSGNTGLRSPTANAADSGGDGNGFQTNPTNAYADDGLFAADTDSGSGTSTSCTGTSKDKHAFRDYGLSIPNGSTVKGIEVRLDAKVDSTSGSPKLCVQLSWNGGSSWTTAKSTSTLSTTEATRMLGSATDTWGHAWTAGELSNANFRVRVISVASSTSRDFSLDWVAVRASY